MSTRVYRYGIPRPDKSTRAAIREQLWQAYRYRLMLWHLAMAQRAAYRQMRREHMPELVESEQALERARELYGLIEKDARHRRERQAAKVEEQRLKAKCKELREAAKSDTAFAAAAATLSERQGVLQRALRNVFSRTLGLYSGTYLHVEAAARSANAGREDPKRPIWRGVDEDGEGALAIQLQGGRTCADLFSGSDPSIGIERPMRAGQSRRMGSRTTCRYRLRSGPCGKAVAIALPLVMHRDLPEDARVTWAKLVVSRVHEHRFDYSLQLTVESSQASERQAGAGLVAVCLRDDKITYACEYGDEREYRFDTRTEKLRDLQSIRDQHRNAATGLLVGWCERQDETADWVRDEIAAIQERKSCRRLYHLRERLRGVVDARISAYLDEWAYRENHLYWWQSDARTNALRARKDAYRRFAADLRSRFRQVVVDSRRLDGRERLTDERRWFGLHELRLAITQAFGDDAHQMPGDSCAELCERFRGAHGADVARINETPSNDNGMERAGMVKRTGFARKHRAREESARNAAGNAAE